MSQDFDYYQDVLLKNEDIKPFKPTSHPLPELLAAIEAADRIDDARVLTAVALSQVKEKYESGSTLHKVVSVLQAIQSILEVETETLCASLGSCQDALRSNH